MSSYKPYDGTHLYIDGDKIDVVTQVDYESEYEDVFLNTYEMKKFKVSHHYTIHCKSGYWYKVREITITKGIGVIDSISIKKQHIVATGKKNVGSVWQGIGYISDKDGNYLATGGPVAKGGFVVGGGMAYSGNKFSSRASNLPGVNERVKHPINGSKLAVRDIIINLNDKHEWTREQIADWLETLDIDLAFPVDTETEDEVQ